jgi:hypothetical protein
MRDPMRTRIGRNNAFPRRFVRRSANTRQQTRLRDHHRARTNRNQILQLRVRRGDILQRSVEIRRASSGSTGDEQDFDIRWGGCVSMGWGDGDEGTAV